jgi:uncharacterized protein GlcG (DUF336 family)
MSIAISRWILIKLVIQNLMALVTSLAIAFTAMAPGAFADGELTIEHRLPLQTALEAATTAITTCQQQGVTISVSVVDQHGQPILKLQGDGAAPHTFNLSEQKAYTAAALGPLQGVTSTGEVGAKLRLVNQAIGELALPSAPIDGIIPIPGGVIIKTTNGEVIGAIGISGASTGYEDERCAHAGISAIKGALSESNKA